MKVKIKLLDKENVRLPKYATPGSSGLDLATIEDTVILQPGQRRRFPLGFALELPPGYEGQVRPRSGMSERTGVIAVLGTIDEDYRGEVGVLLINQSTFPAPIRKHERVAQLVIAPVLRAELQVEEELSATQRGAGGWGHTGR